jgi:hypothetical protein
MNGMLGEPIEEFTSGCGGSAVKPEGELVEIVLQMLIAYRTLMGAQQPAFQQRDHPVNTWQKMLACGLLALNKPFVLITLHLAISIEAISNNRAAGFYALSNEPCKVSRLVSGMRARRMRPMPLPSCWAATAIRLLV